MSYLKGHYRIIPREIREINPPKDTPFRIPESPDRGAHWVGWIWVEHKSGSELFAVWQDYKKRGFFVLRDGEGDAITLPGTTLEGLATRLEELE